MATTQVFQNAADHPLTIRETLNGELRQVHDILTAPISGEEQRALLFQCQKSSLICLLQLQQAELEKMQYALTRLEQQNQELRRQCDTG